MEQHTPCQRFGQAIRIRPDKLDDYKALHKDPWPCVLETLKRCHIRNYSIFLFGDYLFTYFEYIGPNFSEDMKRMAEDPCTQQWWQQTAPCQIPLGSDPANGWVDLEQVFFME